MNKPPNKKPAPAAKSRKSKKRPAAAKDRSEDSDDIERAVYDGMQDLRVKNPHR